MKTQTLSLPVLVAVILIGGASTLSCKEGDPLVTPTPVIPDFTAMAPTVTTDYVSLRRATVDGSRITLDVVVTNVDEPISAIALKLTYPNDFARFSKCSDGNLFSVPGTCYSAEPAPGSGEVFIGRSIVAPELPVAVSGSKVAVRLEFIVFGSSGADGSPIVFEGQNLGGGDASAVLDATGAPMFVHWYAGKLIGR